MSIRQRLQSLCSHYAWETSGGNVSKSSEAILDSLVEEFEAAECIIATGKSYKDGLFLWFVQNVRPDGAEYQALLDKARAYEAALAAYRALKAKAKRDG